MTKNDFNYLLPMAIEMIADSIFITDKTGVILYANSAFEKMTGYNREEAVGNTPSIFKSGKHDKNYYARMWDCLLNGKVFNDILINRKKDGKIYYEQKTIAPIKDEQNGITHFISAGREITKIIRQRDLLVQKAKQLHEVNGELQTFFYKASHDLKGPIASIIGLTGIFRSEIKDKMALEYCGMVEESARRLDHILTGLLKITVLQKHTPEKEPVNFDELINEIFRSIEMEPAFQSTRFDVDIRQHNPFYSDRILLLAVLQNIIDNAIKYRNSKYNILEGEHKLLGHEPHRVSIQIHDVNQGVLIQIVDNGIGMNAHVRNNAFDMFYRGTDMSKGSGLGLYIVKNAVRRLKGSIDVQSEEKIGTTFTIRVPSLVRKATRQALI